VVAALSRRSRLAKNTLSMLKKYLILRRFSIGMVVKRYLSTECVYLSHGYDARPMRFESK
jgi:hypothetical protein